MGPACDDEDSRAEGSQYPFLRELAVLHRGKEMNKPAKFATFQGAVEFVPEDQGQGSTDNLVS